MKKQIYLPIKKQLILLAVMLGFMAVGLAQKSIIAMKEDSNMKYLKSLAAVIANIENDYSGYFVKPVELKDLMPSSSNLKFEEYVLVPEYAVNEEEKIEIEDWMLDEEHFRINSSDDIYDMAEEEELVIEKWMLDEEHFRLPVNENELYEVAEEEELVIEDWMLDESHFLSNNNLNEKENAAEDELKVEDWMLDPEHWVSRAD